jgi:LysR family nitrogen assimilation transcriptional regulator
MDLRQLEYFVQVVEAGGFSQAAAQLNLTQSALSRQVGHLESELGQRLLSRTGRGVLPTEAGTALHDHAKAILELADQVREELRALKTSPRGHLSVGLPPRVAHVLTAPLVERFCERFPRAMLTVVEGLSTNLREWLISGRIDLALMFEPAAAPQLTYEMRAQEPLVLAGPAEGDRLPARIDWPGLAKWPLVLPRSPNSVRLLVDSALRSRQAAVRIVAEVESVVSSLSLVARGIGCSVLPLSSLSAHQIGRHLQVARIGPPEVQLGLVLALPRARPMTRLVRETAELLRGLNFLELVRGEGPKLDHPEQARAKANSKTKR